jgi:hypothetical protein
MSEIIIPFIVLNGITYTYTAMYVMNIVLFYSEIQTKLGYIWLSKAPTKKEVKTTLNYANKTTEIIGNSYSLLSATQKTFKIKKKIIKK